MSPEYTVALLGVAAIFALVLLNAYFVATEFSLVAVRRSQVKLWERERAAAPRRRRAPSAASTTRSPPPSSASRSRASASASSASPRSRAC